VKGEIDFGVEAGVDLHLAVETAGAPEVVRSMGPVATSTASGGVFPIGAPVGDLYAHVRSTDFVNCGATDCFPFSTLLILVYPDLISTV
jgi:hypothetical protein